MDEFTPRGHGPPGRTFWNVAFSSWLPQIIPQKILPKKKTKKTKKKRNFSAIFNHALSISIDRLRPAFHQPISDKFWFYIAYDHSLLKSFAFPLKFSSIDSKFGICFPIWGSHIAHKKIFSCLELCCYTTIYGQNGPIPQFLKIFSKKTLFRK